MKASFFQHKTQQPCGTSNWLCWQQLLQPGLRLTHARKRLSNLRPALVKLAIRATLLAGTTLKQKYAGLLLLALAPISEVAFRFFDPKAGLSTDYWSTHYFLHSSGPHISGLLTATGFYFLVHDKWRNWAILPAAYKFSKILWLASVSSNEQLHAFVPFGFLLLGLCTALLWFLSFDYMMSLHFHKREGIIRRIIGIMIAPGISAEEKERIARDQIKQLNQVEI